MKSKEKIYKRNCPKCGKELTTKNKYWNKKAIEENRSCISCTKIDKKFTEEHKKNLKKNHADFTGENNPFFDKTHTKESMDKMVETRNQNENWLQNVRDAASKQNRTGVNNSFFDKTHTKETKRKMKKYASNRSHIHNEKIRKSKHKCIINGKRLAPNYNPTACIYFDWLNMYWDLNIQHAENGGEYHIKGLGYWVDGYDKETNTVYEFDEKHHFRGGKLKNEDVERQQKIINKLLCEFIRIRATGEVTIFSYEN